MKVTWPSSPWPRLRHAGSFARTGQHASLPRRYVLTPFSAKDVQRENWAPPIRCALVLKNGLFVSALRAKLSWGRTSYRVLTRFLLITTVCRSTHEVSRISVFRNDFIVIVAGFLLRLLLIAKDISKLFLARPVMFSNLFNMWVQYPISGGCWSSNRFGSWRPGLILDRLKLV